MCQLNRSKVSNKWKRECAYVYVNVYVCNWCVRWRIPNRFGSYKYTCIMTWKDFICAFYNNPMHQGDCKLSNSKSIHPLHHLLISVQNILFIVKIRYFRLITFFFLNRINHFERKTLQQHWVWLLLLFFWTSMSNERIVISC